jgi:serine/threonine protein phosphatase PrpC
LVPFHAHRSSSVIDGRNRRQGRVAIVDRESPRIMGVVENTPLETAARKPVDVMVSVVDSLADGPADPVCLLQQVLDDMEARLAQLAAQVPEDEQFEALWDFGGCLALLSVSERSVAIARVGGFRVVLVTDGAVTTLLPESMLIAQFKDAGHEVTRAIPRNVITDCLGLGHTSSEPRVVSLELDDNARVAFLSGESLIDLSDAQLATALRGDAAQASRTTADAIQGTSSNGAVVVVVDLQERAPRGSA